MTMNNRATDRGFLKYAPWVSIFLAIFLAMASAIASYSVTLEKTKTLEGNFDRHCESQKIEQTNNMKEFSDIKVMLGEIKTEIRISRGLRLNTPGQLR